MLEPLLPRERPFGTAFSYDPNNDTFTVGGVSFSGDIVKAFAYLPVGSVFEIVERKNGTAAVKVLKRGETVDTT